MNQHFLQSSAWEKFQQSLGRKVFHNRGEGWEYFAILERGTGNSRLYCPFGPTATNEKNLQLALKDLADLGRKLGVTFLRVGPIKPPFLRYYLMSIGRKPLTSICSQNIRTLSTSNNQRKRL